MTLMSAVNDAFWANWACIAVEAEVLDFFFWVLLAELTDGPVRLIYTRSCLRLNLLPLAHATEIITLTA